MTKVFTSLIFLFTSICCLAEAPINHFMVKESLLANGTLAVVVCDSTDTPIGEINGNYDFTLNGFQQRLSFHDGIALAPQKIEKSTFVLLRHDNEQGSHNRLYYVWKKGDELNPIAVSSSLILGTPIVILLLIFIFRRLLILGIILLAVYLYFSYQGGLSFAGFFDLIRSALSGLL
jgi:hypothetical protein